MISIGDKLENFLIKAEIGRGGMGTIYHAVDTMLNREVALKVIHAQLADNQQLMERFKIEAMTQARLNHPNIVTIFSFNKIGDEYLIAMEYVEGKSLKELLHEKKQFHPAEAVDIIAQVAEGLGYAHSHNVIHRDIKPANILIGRDGKVKISDFGIAKIFGSQSLTKTGMLVGTPWYTSPEQIIGKEIDFRTDLYSLGVTFYEVLTGRVPFDSETNSEFQIQKAHLETPPPRPSIYNQEIGLKLEKFILTALQKKPEKRFQSARDMIAGLRNLHSELTKAGLTGPPGVTQRIDSPLPKKRRSLLTPLKILSFLVILLAGVALFIFLSGKNSMDEKESSAGALQGSETSGSPVVTLSGQESIQSPVEGKGASGGGPGIESVQNPDGSEAAGAAAENKLSPQKIEPSKTLPSNQVELGSLDHELGRLRGFLESRDFVAAERLSEALIRSGPESRAFPFLGKVKFLLNQFAAAERLWTRALQDNLMITLEVAHLHGSADDFCVGQFKFKKKLIMFNSTTRGDHSFALTSGDIQSFTLGDDLRIRIKGRVGGQEIAEELMVLNKVRRLQKEKFLVDFINRYVL